MDKDHTATDRQSTTAGFNTETSSSDQNDDERPQTQNNRQRANQRPYTPKYKTPPRQPASERENAFHRLAWLLEGATGFIEELRHSDLGLTEEFWVHTYAARHESLLALRAVLDKLIERSSAQADKETEAEQRCERRGAIDIEF